MLIFIIYPYICNLFTENLVLRKTNFQWQKNIVRQLFQSRYIQSHWMAYAEGCEKAKRQPDPAIWRIARSILVTDDAHQAEDYVANSDGGFSFYFRYFMDLYRNRGILKMLKPDLNVLDGDLRLNDVIRSMVTFGVVDSVLDQLVVLCESWGPFGTLLMVSHDWDDKALWQRSMTLLAQEVMPRLNQHLESIQTD